MTWQPLIALAVFAVLVFTLVLGGFAAMWAPVLRCPRCHSFHVAACKRGDR
jgi:hypothetical protein